MADNRKLRILCIHGYRQNARSFREKTGSLRKITKKLVDYEYVSAQHRVPPGNMGSAAWEGADEAEDTGELGWWFSREDHYFKSTDYSDVSVGFDESVNHIRAILERGYVEKCDDMVSVDENGHSNDSGSGSNVQQKYDGVLAFSQGASFLSMLCLMQQKEAKQWFKFAILVAGFKSRSSKHSVNYEGTASLPSLHVYGETDQIVVPSMSEELLQYFDKPKVLLHPGGHFVPASSAQKKIYVEFLEEMMKLT